MAGLREHWESVGEDYWHEWDPPARARLGERELDFISAGLKASPARRALDVGIGSGRILSELAKRSPETEFFGVDIAQAMVDATRERMTSEGRTIELAVCDLSKEPVPFEGSFDFISAIRMLKYNDNWREMAAKLVDRLGSGGVIVLTMTNRNSLNRISRPYAVPWGTATRRELEELVKELGLEVLDVAGFTKLPHAFYSGANKPWLAKTLLGIDAGLDRVVGSATWAREIFVSARKP